MIKHLDPHARRVIERALTHDLTTHGHSMTLLDMFKVEEILAELLAAKEQDI